MYMYALATLPLIESLPNQVDQIWFADNAGRGGTLQNTRCGGIRCLWKGPKYGYYPNAVKSYLLVKSNYLEEVFRDHHMNITNEERNYLGSPISTSDYIKDSCKSKVAE